MTKEAEPLFISLDQVMELHRESIETHGGIAGVRDPGAVDSALASAQNTWSYARGDLHDIAAAYAFHIAESQAFLDGNKRTAAASAIVFLVSNDCADCGDDRVIYDAMLAVASRRLDKPGLAAIFRRQFPKP
jgi:death-on-curing protein